MNYAYVCGILSYLLLTFIWLTAISGTKFYEVSMARKDIKTLKLVINLAFAMLILLNTYQFFIGVKYVQKMAGEEKIREVQTGQSETER